MFASAELQNSSYDTSPVAVVVSEAFAVSWVDELLPPQAPKTSNATSGKLRLTVLRMESIRWLVTFIRAKLVDSRRLSKSGTEGLSPINLDCYSFCVVNGVQPFLQTVFTPIYR